MKGKADRITAPALQAVIYARVSSKEQDREGFSIPAQLNLLHDYAVKNGIEVRRDFVDIETAKRTGRTQFAEMIALLRRENLDRKNIRWCILVEKTDRLYRNIKDWVTIDDLNVEIHFVKENVVLSDESRSSEKFMHGIKVLMAKNYIDNLSEEASKGMLEKARQGLYPTHAPFGYRNFVDNHRKIIIPHEIFGSLVTQMFAWYATEKYALSDISERLKNDFNHLFRDRKLLTKSHVHQILTNPIYYGEFIWKGEYYQGIHEPLVNRSLFDAVQDLLRKNRQGKLPRKRHKFMLQGLVKCGHCGCAMVAEQKKGKYIYYHCTQNRGKCPGGVSVPEAEFDRQFIESLRSIEMPEKAVAYVVQALKDSHRDKQTYKDRVVAKLRSDMQRIESRIEAMYLDKLDGKVDPGFFDRKRREWQRDVDRLQVEITKHINANDSYIDEGVRILEHLQHAVITYNNLAPDQKGTFLKIAHSNSTWKDGQLHHIYTQPFDFIVEINRAYKQKMATLPEKSDHCLVWLGYLDSNQE